MSERFRVARIDELEPQQGDEGARWYRLRRDLDVKAFGVGAYGADAGKRVIEEHDELGTAAGKHEELYVVVHGRARFQLNGEEHVLGAGEVVFIPDPTVRRGALAEEDGTMVLVVGGVPGAPYEVSAWEAAADAYPLWRQGDYDGAVKILRGVVADHPDAGIVLYNLACAEVLAGETEPAHEHLRRAVQLEDRFRELARSDEDLDAIREDPRFKELVGTG